MPDLPLYRPRFSPPWLPRRGWKGLALYDALPASPPGTFVLIGPEEVLDASDQSGAGAEHRLLISVISDASGFLASKQLAVAIADALAPPPAPGEPSAPYPSLSRGRIVSLSFERARARRLDQGAVRRIDLTFRVRVEL